MTKNVTTSDLRGCKINDNLMCSLGINRLTRGKVYPIHMVSVKGPVVLNDDGEPVQVSFDTDAFIPMPKTPPESSMYSSVTETTETIEGDIPSDAMLWHDYALAAIPICTESKTVTDLADRLLIEFKKRFIQEEAEHDTSKP